MANVLNALTSIASFAWAVTSSIVSVITLYNGWVPSEGIMVCISMAVCVLWLLMASIRMDKATGIVFVSTICFFIGLPVAHSQRGIPFVSGAKVFGEYSNFSDWNRPVAVPMTFFSAAWVITGWNAPAAVAEETHNARVVAPRNIVITYSLMATMGFIICILLAFCITDMESAAGDST
ncbi:hypothetical protein EsH8_VI_001089 [Colletotrichum jinshuiense]